MGIANVRKHVGLFASSITHPSGHMLWGVVAGKAYKTGASNPAKQKTELVKRYLQEIGAWQEVRQIFLPVPTESNAKIIDVTHHSALSRTFQTHEGEKVDGYMLTPGMSVAIFTADCPTIVVHERTLNVKAVVVAHAGLASMVDKHCITHGKPSRDTYGVLDKAVDMFKKLGVKPDRLAVKAVCGIRTGFQYSPSHSRYGRQNRNILAHLHGFAPSAVDLKNGNINMLELIKARANHLGIKYVWLDPIDTFADRSKSGEFMWASHARYVKSGRPSVLRNMVVVCLV